MPKTRRQKRYERRKQKRLDNRERILGENIKFKTMCTYFALYTAMLDSAKGVKWKASVQRYILNSFFNVNKSKRDLEREKDIRKGFIYFDISERGKTRHISSVHFSERVIQKCFCTNILVPTLTHSLIHDNGASQEDKGVHFSLGRMKEHLLKHFKKFGNKGYILLKASKISFFCLAPVNTIFPDTKIKSTILG